MLRSTVTTDLLAWTPGAEAGAVCLVDVFHPEGDTAVDAVETDQIGLGLGLTPSLLFRRFNGEGGG